MKIVKALLPFLRVVASEDFLWATSGGGWRAMAGSMAFSNVFYQAGLFSDDSSSFSGVSSNSGGTWFSTQFFYSRKFHDAMKRSPEEVAKFFRDWMYTYKDMIPGIDFGSTHSHVMCEELRDSIIDKDYDLATGEYNRCVAISEADCGFLTPTSWACWINSMLKSTSTNYGDTNFNNVKMTPENRLEPLKNTFLAAMIGLSSSTLQRGKGNRTNVCTFLGPSDTAEGEIYNTVLPFPFVVSNGSAEWLEDYITNSKIYLEYCDSDYSNYEMYFTEGKGSTTIQYPVPLGGHQPHKSLTDPFGGSPTVVQIAASSSAAAAVFSPLTGALFMQFYKMYLNLPNWYTSLLYYFTINDLLAVCSQWPDKEYCGQEDAQFVDGGNVDNPALVSSIAAYQKESGTSTKLKVVLNVHNEGVKLESDYPQFLAYFATDFNIDVKPGEYLILPNEGAYNPLPSPQIFDEEVKNADLKVELKPLIGTKSQYATFKLTTIDNSVYSVKGGQSVELLVFFLNYEADVLIFTKDAVDQHTPVLSDMIVAITTSADVLKVVETFFDVDEDEEEDGEDGEDEEEDGEEDEEEDD